MTAEQQLKLQALLDGELPEKEARETAAWVARDAEAADLARELRQTRQALADAEPGLRVAESREFYWSRIERDIRRLEQAPTLSQPVSVLARLRRLLVPVSAVAALVVIVLATGLWVGFWGRPIRPDTEMTMADSGAFTYHDYANGTTLVWLDYPAER
jgi:anti-sigma factor RsiW